MSTRRHLLNTWLGAALAQVSGIHLASAALAQTPSAQTAPVFERDPFAMGVASGSPTPSSVVLWTRLIPFNSFNNPWQGTPITVQWELALDADFAQVQRVGSASALPALGHSVHVEIDGLTSNTHYFYRFRVGAASKPLAQSAAGRTRTLPAHSATPGQLRFAFASCQRFHSGFFTAYKHMLSDDPDVVVFMGDYIYEGGARAGEVRGPAQPAARSLEDYRGLYELARSDPALQRMHAHCPWLILWDDHEVGNDYAGGPVRLRAESGRIARQMAMGYQAWYENMPVSIKALVSGIEGLLEGKSETRIYDTLNWGQLAKFYLLDTRQYRDAHISCGIKNVFVPEDCTEHTDPSRSMLGRTQEAWLEGALARAKAGPHTWHLLCQTTVFSQFRFPVLGGRAWADCWDGYAASRDRLVGALVQHRVPNPVFFGGDIHQNWVAHVAHKDTAGKTQNVAAEFCGTSISTGSFYSYTAQEQMALCPDCVYADRHKRGYGLVHVTAEKIRVDLRVVDQVRSAISTVSTAASFDVLAKPPTQALDALPRITQVSPAAQR